MARPHHWIYSGDVDPNAWGSFTYMAVCNETGHKYIGSKTFTADWHYYKTSSSVVKRMIDEGKTFSFSIIELFSGEADAIKAESQLLCYYNVENDPLFLNRKATVPQWTRIGKTTIHSPETIEKIRAAKKGKNLSKEHKANISKGNIGRVQSEETKAKIRAKKKGKKRSKEECENISKGLIGKKRSAKSIEATRQKLLGGAHHKFKGWYVVNGERYPSMAQGAKAANVGGKKFKSMVESGEIVFIPKDEG